MLTKERTNTIHKPHWFWLVLLIVAGGLFCAFIAYGTTPDTYVIVSKSFDSSPYLVLNSNVLKASVHKNFTGVIIPHAIVHSVLQEKVAQSPSHYNLHDIIKGAMKTPNPKEENIFFIESSCAVTGSKNAVHMNGRQACAIESAALTNPSATVYFLDTCGGARMSSEPNSKNDRLIHEVLKYPNVKMFHVDINSYLRDTPLHEWISNGHLSQSKFPVEHSSDILRLVTLWKFGGVYLDLDFIVLRSLTVLKKNFVVAESDETIANSVLSFSAEGFGHEVVSKCLSDLRAHFNGEIWSYNGPQLITRVFEKVCNGVPVPDMTPHACKGFTVHKPNLFFPFYYPEWKLLFNEDTSDNTMDLVLKNGTYGVHAWNKMSHGEPVIVGSKQPYALLAGRFCPKVYSVVGKTF